MPDLTIPPDLLVTGPDGTRPASQIRPVLSGTYDGHVGFGGLTGIVLPPCAFTFSIAWHQSLAGRGYEDMCAMAAEMGARLAAEKPDWPSGEAHVRGLPVVSFTFEFAVTPERLPIVEHKGGGVTSTVEAIAARLPEGAAREQMMAAAAQARLCESGQCDCA